MFLRMVLCYVLGGCSLVALAASPTIPALQWTERSDWVNVKTAVTPGAVGDGVADDTTALQQAFDLIKDGLTIYLPAGTYRITKTLVLKPKLRVSGLTLIGHGRDTRIVWDGPAGGDMLLVSGATNSRYVGLLFDGRGKAAVAFHHHNADGHFETEVRHQHLAFLNCTDAGILVDSTIATAETITENCLFEKCKRGIAFLNFNDYNYVIDGCEFRQCETAVQCLHGNTYIRNCHFDGSTSVDISLGPEHHSSVRRCTSVGSKMFIAFANAVSPLVVENCRVAGWTNPDGAITLSGAPVTLYDCVFTNPPGKTAPVKLMRDGQRLFTSQNLSAATDGVVQPGGMVYDIPAGKRSGAPLTADRHFIREKVTIPTVVFDAKRDFGATGDGHTDDTAAIQQAIDAARAHGKGAIAYLPTGIYCVSRTLRVTGANYSVGGSGFSSGLSWTGPAGGAMIEVQDPERITLENLNVGSHDIPNGSEMKNGMDILQTSSGVGKPSSIVYDNITVFGRFDKQPFRKGLWLRGLDKNAVVHIAYMEGNLHLVDAAQATVLVGNHVDGSTVVEGKDPRRNGFTGMLMSLRAC